MAADKAQSVSTMSTRQMVTGVIVLLVLIVLAWQVHSLFGGGSSTVPATNPSTPNATNQNMSSAMMKNNSGGGMQPQPAQITPTPTAVPAVAQDSATTAREAQLMQLQQQTEANYLKAMNDLQVLRVQRDIAETNQAIMAAQLSQVQAEKKIVDLLAPPAPPPTSATYAKNLVNPVNEGNPMPLPSPEATYTVISVSQLQYQWSAVVGSQGNLYSVRVGDILPADGSRVMSIDKSGIMLQKNGATRKISLIPII